MGTVHLFESFLKNFLLAGVASSYDVSGSVQEDNQDDGIFWVSAHRIIISHNNKKKRWCEDTFQKNGNVRTRQSLRHGRAFCHL
jgi:hypothetical protein